MKDDEFKALLAKAQGFYASQPSREKNKVSLDAIFIALAAAQEAGGAKMRKIKEEKPPKWFTDTFKRLRGTKQRMNVSLFLMQAGRFPVTRADSVAVGRWLREAGITPSKTGGNVIFEL